MHRYHLLIGTPTQIILYKLLIPQKSVSTYKPVLSLKTKSMKLLKIKHNLSFWAPKTIPISPSNKRLGFKRKDNRNKKSNVFKASLIISHRFRKILLNITKANPLNKHNSRDLINNKIYKNCSKKLCKIFSLKLYRICNPKIRKKCNKNLASPQTDK
jgi:hypothetical protein